MSNPTGHLQGVNERFPDKAGETFPQNPQASVSGGCRVGFIGQIWCETCEPEVPSSLEPLFCPSEQESPYPACSDIQKNPALSNTLFQLQVTFDLRLEIEITHESF